MVSGQVKVAGVVLVLLVLLLGGGVNAHVM
jgi:hypothetical protein